MSEKEQQVSDGALSTEESSTGFDNMNTTAVMEADQGSASEKHVVYRLMIWGSGEMDQFPVESEADDQIEAEYQYPTPIHVADEPIEVYCGAMHNVLKTQGGVLYSWGCNDQGALGRATSPGKDALPGIVPISESVKFVVCGDSYTAILTAAGRVLVAGVYRDFDGLIGHPIHMQKSELFHTWGPIDFYGDVIVSLAGGENHTVCKAESGAVYAWGSNEFGQLTQPLPSENELPVSLEKKQQLLSPIKLNFEGRVSNVFCGGQTTFLCMEDGIIYGVGRNAMGEVGIGSNETKQVWSPSKLDLDGRTVEKIVGGQHVTLALQKDGRVLSWGMGVLTGQGIEDSWQAVCTPTPIVELKGIESVSCGSDHCFAIDQEGALWSWGCGQCFQLGNGSDAIYVSKPHQCDTKLLSSRVVVAAGGSQHSVALVVDEQASVQHEVAAPVGEKPHEEVVQKVEVVDKETPNADQIGTCADVTGTVDANMELEELPNAGNEANKLAEHNERRDEAPQVQTPEVKIAPKKESKKKEKLDMAQQQNSVDSERETTRKSPRLILARSAEVKTTKCAAHNGKQNTEKKVEKVQKKNVQKSAKEMPAQDSSHTKKEPTEKRTALLTKKKQGKALAPMSKCSTTRRKEAPTALKSGDASKAGDAVMPGDASMSGDASTAGDGSKSADSSKSADASKSTDASPITRQKSKTRTATSQKPDNRKKTPALASGSKESVKREEEEKVSAKTKAGKRAAESQKKTSTKRSRRNSDFSCIYETTESTKKCQRPPPKDRSAAHAHA